MPVSSRPPATLHTLRAPARLASGKISWLASWFTPLIAAAAYLLFWPTPVSPVAWDAPGQRLQSPTRGWHASALEASAQQNMCPGTVNLPNTRTETAREVS